jgi:flagellar basal-body rod protein FlgB
MIDPLIGGLRDVLDLRMQQHALTASNLANADTPGYRARVIDFRTTLTQVMERATSPVVTGDPRHIGGPGSPVDAPVLEIAPPAWSADGNSVFPERESARLAENALMYDAVARGLDHKLTLLKFAVSDGRA